MNTLPRDSFPWRKAKQVTDDGRGYIRNLAWAGPAELDVPQQGQLFG